MDLKTVMSKDNKEIVHEYLRVYTYGQKVSLVCFPTSTTLTSHSNPKQTPTQATSPTLPIPSTHVSGPHSQITMDPIHIVTKISTQVVTNLISKTYSNDSYALASTQP